MKLVEGGQLDDVVKREPITIRRAVELIAKVARIVHYAHEHHILHRDIKPGNILLDQKGEPHLTDFGLARLVETESTVTRTMEVLGTPSYMAPEQAVGNNAAITSTTDVYGLGAVLYQLLTGHPPFAGGTTYETIRLVLDTEPRQPRLWSPKVDRDVSTICLKCLEKDPKRRYSSALALAEDLDHWLKHEPIRARRTGIFARGGKWVRRNPTSALLAVSLVALELAIAVRTLPNNARIFEWTGFIDRRQSRWHDAVRNFERATALDPRNVKILTSAAVTHHLMRSYGQERRTIDRLIALEPNNIGHRLGRAWTDIRERANTRAVHAVLEKIPADNPEWAGLRLDLALYERDAVAADQALAALAGLGEDTFDAGRGGMQFSRAYLQGSVARMKGDAAAAHAAFTVARAQQEEAVRAQPDYGPPLCVLGLIDAGLGRKEEALREGRRALELAPMAKDSLDGVDVLYIYAVICAWTGERDLAIEQLETLAKIPAGPSCGDIRLSPIGTRYAAIHALKKSSPPSRLRK